MTTRIAQFGLGPIGLQTLTLAASRPWADILGAVDIDPAITHRDLGELTGIPALQGKRVWPSLDELPGKPGVVLHTSVSQFARAYPQIAPMARRGIHVVSSAEELVFPQLREPKLAAELDALCRENGARVVGAGVNPGFVMDLLPLFITGVSCRVEAVHVQRVVDASTRREPLQRKIGSGLPPEEFRERLRRGEAGHAGLRESLALIAHGLGWPLGELSELNEVVVAERTIQTRYFEVQAGQACGIHQRLEMKQGSRTRLSLDLRMALDAPDPHDAIQVEGEPPLRVRIEGGVAGDAATAAALVNSVPRLLQASPGLHWLTDLPMPRWG